MRIIQRLLGESFAFEAPQNYKPILSLNTLWDNRSTVLLRKKQRIIKCNSRYSITVAHPSILCFVLNDLRMCWGCTGGMPNGVSYLVIGLQRTWPNSLLRAGPSEALVHTNQQTLCVCLLVFLFVYCSIRLKRAVRVLFWKGLYIRWNWLDKYPFFFGGVVFLFHANILQCLPLLDIFSSYRKFLQNFLCVFMKKQLGLGWTIFNGVYRNFSLTMKC